MAATREERAQQAAHVILTALAHAPQGMPRARLEVVTLGLETFADNESRALRAERDALLEFVNDLADAGIRHDPAPTLRHGQGEFDPDVAYEAYITKIDEDIRARARKARTP